MIWGYFMEPDGKIISFSQSWQLMTGYRIDECHADTDLLEMVVHPDDRPAVARHFHEALESEETSSIDFRMITKDGQERLMRHICHPHYGTDGRYIGRCGINLDIIEQIRAENELKKISDEQAILLDQVPVMIFWIDKQGKFVKVNETFAEVLKRSVVDIRGKSLFELYPEPMARRYYEDNLAVITSGIPKTHIEEIVKTPGGRIWVRTKKIPYRDEDGVIAGIIGFSIDITRSKRMEQALVKREKELKVKEQNLEEANAALRVLLKNLEEEKKEIENKVLFNIEKLVMPYLERLKMIEMDKRQAAYINVLESNLKNIISPLARNLSMRYAAFSPVEIQVANLIRQGKTTKEIAALLNIAKSTVDSHRYQIRRKLRIKGKKINLRSFLERQL